MIGLPDRLEPSDLAPESLAALFRLGLAPSPALDPWREALAQRLFDITVRNAVQVSPFYASHFEDHIDLNQTVDSSSRVRLPPLERVDLERNGDQICSRVATYAFSSYTSGTTTASPLVIHRSEEEQGYLTQFYHCFAPWEFAEAGPPPLTLVLATWHHGRQLAVPGRVFSFPVSLISYTNTSIGYHQAASLLARSFWINGESRRISQVSGPSLALESLGNFLDGEGLRHLVDPVSSIHTTGHYLTRHRRHRLEQLWHCRLYDRFSFTELFFGASHCGHCGWYHFDPFGLAEVVDVQRGMPIEVGRGRLLVTGFYPFNQMTPLIRYATGDLVEVAQVDCAITGRGFRFLGRTGSAVMLQDLLGPNKFLASAELYETLDPFEEVARRPLAIPIPESASKVKTLPMFSLRREGETIVLDVELRFSPAEAPTRADELQVRICRALEAEAGVAAELLQRNLLKLRLLRPQELMVSPTYRL